MSGVRPNAARSGAAAAVLEATARGAGERPEPAPLTWRWNPWREVPGRAALAALGTLAASAVTALVTRSALLWAPLALAVAGALAPLLVPQRCRVDHAGVRVRGAFGWEARPWSDIRRAVASTRGLWVSPLAKPGRRDTFRALYLPLPRAEAAALTDRIGAHLEHHGF